MGNPKNQSETRFLRTQALPRFSVLDFKYKFPVMDMDPPYQREGSVWSENQKRRLVDTVINRLDMPKLYFEVVRNGRTTEAGRTIQYAVLDGKQRLAAIKDFLDDRLRLPADFIYFDKPEVCAAEKTFSELQTIDFGGELVDAFLNYCLPVVEVYSNSGDLVEEMFQRLNSATSLNAAERRNAISGEVRDASNSLSTHRFFKEQVAIRDARYKYRELSSKFLLIEYQLKNLGRIRDTKAKTLMKFFEESRDEIIGSGEVRGLESTVQQNLTRMSEVFEDNDSLLRSIGTVIVYYIAFRDRGFAQAVSRDALDSFECLRRDSDDVRDEFNEVGEVLRKYNAFVQSTNDGIPLNFRAEVIKEFVLSGGREEALLRFRDEDVVSSEDFWS